MIWPASTRELGVVMEAASRLANEAGAILADRFGNGAAQPPAYACALLSLAIGLMKLGGCSRKRALDIAATLYDRMDVVTEEDVH